MEFLHRGMIGRWKWRMIEAEWEGDGKVKEHRRRIRTEVAKVVVSVWREECIQFLAALAILPRTILKNRMNSSFSFKSSWCNSSYSIIKIILGKTASAASLPLKHKWRSLPCLLECWKHWSSNIPLTINRWPIGVYSIEKVDKFSIPYSLTNSSSSRGSLGSILAQRQTWNK